MFPEVCINLIISYVFFFYHLCILWLGLYISIFVYDISYEIDQTHQMHRNASHNSCNTVIFIGIFFTCHLTTLQCKQRNTMLPAKPERQGSRVSPQQNPVIHRQVISCSITQQQRSRQCLSEVR